MGNLEKANQERISMEKIDRQMETCPFCRHELIPVWQLPQEKITFIQPAEIRQQFYCGPSDRRCAIKEIDFLTNDTSIR